MSLHGSLSRRGTDPRRPLHQGHELPLERPGYAETGHEALNITEVLHDCLECALLAIDDQKRLTMFNSAAQHLTLLKPDEVLHQTLEVLPANLREVLLETLATGKPVAGRQIIFPANDPAGITVRVSTSLTRTQKGAVSGVVAVLHDLTAFTRYEQSMRQFDRLASIGTLSASMAHEIKNALVAVKTFVELLLQQNPAAELADIVNRETRRIDAIVSQMLKFAGPARPTFSSIHLHEILEHALRLVRHQLEGKKITLTCSLEASPDLVLGDDYQLEQAFLNLFFNAVEAMGPNGRLTVATEALPPADAREQPQIRILVKDTGTGIAPENLSRLFAPFFTTKATGTGLGLPITRRIIQEHSGSVSVESELNQGTTFRVDLPLNEKSF